MYFYIMDVNLVRTFTARNRYQRKPKDQNRNLRTKKYYLACKMCKIHFYIKFRSGEFLELKKSHNAYIDPTKIHFYNIPTDFKVIG